MAGRRTNLALLLLGAAALASGVLAFAIGTSWSRWPVVAHAVAGIAMVLLVPWKSVIVGRGLRRARSGRFSSILLGILVTVAIVSGMLFSTGLVLRYGPLTAIQVHVGSALIALPLAVWHVRVRPVKPRRIDLARRNVLRAGGLLAGATALYVTAEGVVRLVSLPGARRRFTGSHERGSFRPEAMPVTQWFNDRVQRIDPASWTLIVRDSGGSREWSRDELVALDDRVTATLDCTGGWYATQEWTGVGLDRLVSPGEGHSLFVKSATGYSRRFPIEDLPNLWLATGVGGRPLSRGHGFPARIVAPGRRGFWWVKWVTEIRVDERAWWLQPPFPLT
ncbi:MAG: molybdopterin-dependent oxidoreductase [Acidimicrobiia bacterium]